MHASARRLLIAGHLHLDGVLRGLPGQSDAHQDLLRDAPLAAFEALVEAALEREVEAVLLTGSLFDGDPTIRGAALFRDAVETLLEEGIAVVYCGPRPDQIHSLMAARCCPEDLEILEQNRHRRIVLPAANGDNDQELEIVSVDQPGYERLQHSGLTIGVTRNAFGHVTPEHPFVDENHAPCPLVLSSGHETPFTQRVRNTMLHAPGSLQAVAPVFPGTRSATFCRIDADGTVELTPLTTAPVLFLQQELNLHEGESLDSLLSRCDEACELLALESVPAATQIGIVNWYLRGTGSTVAQWSSETVSTEMQTLLGDKLDSITLLHQATVVPQLVGVHLDGEDLTEEAIEDELLRLVSEQVAAEAGQSHVYETSKGRTTLPFDELRRQIDSREICHRAAELGLRALKEQKKAS